MKKKDDTNQTSMPEFAFKEFTAEEDAIYTESIQKYRDALAVGQTLKQAYDGVAVSDAELRALIQADFLKILIAERHFAGRQSLEDIAKALGVLPELVKDTYKRMLQEVGVTASNHFGQEMAGNTPPVTND